ncbi:mechanosensitive ion channel family protein [Pseudomonas sp. KK4]|uniref:mechanosensitive ion channel family protein n=1 Tax=Pseudomonas sp. KK4 TaxID=1855729 RepID=UPI00097C7E0D|nr:mechanosensitive ion channel family protein [Pseudomonas sp. KK4]
MLSLFAERPLICALVLFLIDAVLWRTIGTRKHHLRVLVRLVIFSLYSVLLFNEGLSPLEPAPWGEDVPLHMAATALQIGWWLFAARTLTVLIGTVMMQRVGHTGRLLQDLLGALIFLIAVIAALAYVLNLPVKGVLATSGALAIIVGLALQSTLSDVFSGIVLNTTKPYQIDDWIAIDGTEGRVTEIDWRATFLQTSQGSMIVIPNSMAAKAKITNFSRPSDMFGVSISLLISPHVRPNRVFEALERAAQGCRILLTKPAPKVTIKSTSSTGVEYEVTVFVVSMDQKRSVRNQMYDLAYRHLLAAGISWLSTIEEEGAPAQSRARALLDNTSIFATNLSEEDKDHVSLNMKLQSFPPGEMILAGGQVSTSLYIIESGVVTVSLFRAGTKFEAGRMGPGEVIGEGGIVSGTALPAEFSAFTFCNLYRIDREYLSPCVEARHEMCQAMKALLDFRLQIAHTMTQEEPKVIEKRGLLQWLRSRV